NIDDAHPAIVIVFLEPVPAVQASPAGAAQQGHALFTGFDFGHGGDVLGQHKGPPHQGQGNGPEHQHHVQATDARCTQNDQLIALCQTGQGQGGANQQTDGQQVVQTGGQFQGLDVKQIHQGEFGTDLVQLFNQGEKGKQAKQGNQHHGAGAIDFGSEIAACGAHENRAQERRG